jgi:mRNA-degrading endonuclease toxin of MazEF toxin-antitoxin module
VSENLVPRPWVSENPRPWVSENPVPSRIAVTCRVELIGQVHTLSTQRLGATIGRVSPEELEQLVEGLHEIVGP